MQQSLSRRLRLSRTTCGRAAACGLVPRPQPHRQRGATSVESRRHAKVVRAHRKRAALSEMTHQKDVNRRQEPLHAVLRVCRGERARHVTTSSSMRGARRQLLHHVVQTFAVQVSPACHCRPHFVPFCLAFLLPPASDSLDRRPAQRSRQRSQLKPFPTHAQAADISGACPPAMRDPGPLLAASGQTSSLGWGEKEPLCHIGKKRPCDP